MRLPLGRLALLVALLVGCATARDTGLRSTPQSRYQGMVLDVRDLGAGQLAAVQKDDPAIAAYVAKNGAPDFLLMPTPNDVELIYYLRSVVVQFHRPSPGAPSVAGQLTPLPDAILAILPADIQAGTPPRPPESGADCWTVSVGAQLCKTCCAGPMACVGSCKPGRMQ